MGCGVEDLGFRVWGVGCGVEDLGFRVWGVGCGILGLGSTKISTAVSIRVGGPGPSEFGVENSVKEKYGLFSTSLGRKIQALHRQLRCLILNWAVGTTGLSIFTDDLQHHRAMRRHLPPKKSWSLLSLRRVQTEQR